MTPGRLQNALLAGKRRSGRHRGHATHPMSVDVAHVDARTSFVGAPWRLKRKDGRCEISRTGRVRQMTGHGRRIQVGDDVIASGRTFPAELPTAWSGSDAVRRRVRGASIGAGGTRTCVSAGDSPSRSTKRANRYFLARPLWWRKPFMGGLANGFWTPRAQAIDVENPPISTTI